MLTNNLKCKLVRSKLPNWDACADQGVAMDSKVERHDERVFDRILSERGGVNGWKWSKTQGEEGRG